MSGDKKRIKEQMLINSAIASINRQLESLEASRQRFIEAAAEAKADGIASQYALAKNAVRIVTAQKVVVEQMLLNLRISAQIKDVSEMTKTFADGMKLLSGSIADTASGLKFDKVSRQMDKAMLSTQMKQVQTDEFFDATRAGFEDFSAGTGVGEDEIDRMIDAQSSGDLDSEIAALERKLKSTLTE